MSRYNHKHKLSAKAYLYRILFSLIAIAILVVFMPHGNNATFNYKVGDPWEEEAFIAQDSFPILKSSEQIAEEQESLKQKYEPYFGQDVSILEQQLQALRQDFSSLPMQGTPYYFQPHLREKLNHIYSIGILSGEGVARLESEKPEKEGEKRQKQVPKALPLSDPVHERPQKRAVQKRRRHRDRHEGKEEEEKARLELPQLFRRPEDATGFFVLFHRRRSSVGRFHHEPPLLCMRGKVSFFPFR